MFSPGKKVRIKTKSGLELTGLILPRYELYSPDYVTLKLPNGYNVGIKKDNITRVIEVHEKLREEKALQKRRVQPLFNNKKIVIIGTGGTIASKIDYETGGVKPVLTAEELLESIPELGEIAGIETEVLFNIFSEDMTPRLWGKIAESAIKKLMEEGNRGIIIAHGTDTLAYTSAALSFAIKNPTAPIVLVGSQRSSDRPSSDAAFNIISAAIYATSNIAEVAVVMHGTISDEYALAHRGTRVRKMHSSRRDAFQSIDSVPIAFIKPYEKKMVILRKDVRKIDVKKKPEYKPFFSEKVALIKFYPGMPAWIINEYVDKGFEGIVIEGTGLGHVNEKLLESIEYARKNNVIVVMTTQCLFGKVNLNVYSKGRKLLEKGVVSAGDMLPETAYAKLSWLLANYNDSVKIRELFKKNFVGELEERRTIDVYPRWYHGF